MSKGKPRNLVASVQHQLRKLAKGKSDDFQLTVTRYALERFLYRLSQSTHRRTFVLKGAMLFHLWSDQPHRPTRDVDFLGKGANDPDRFATMVRDICNQEVEADGLIFHAETVTAEQIKEDQEYQGLRIKLTANLGQIRIPIQIDVGFGDAVTPRAKHVGYPAMLDFPAANVLAYPMETVVSEKFQAMVMLGIANSRMKDFYDVWTLASQFEFQGPKMCNAIQATFRRRQTPIPAKPPLALTQEFSEDAGKQTQWKAFIRKAKLLQSDVDFADIVAKLHDFLMPPSVAIARGDDFDQTWSPSGKWK